MESGLAITWAGQEMQAACLKDERQRNNLVRMCLALEEKTGLSFSAACGAALRKAAWRLFSQADIDLEKGHGQQTAARCMEQERILVAEDSTDLNYNGHKAAKDLGGLGGMFNPKGLNIHSALALSGQGEPLGLIGQHIWAPICEGNRKKQIKKIPAQEKESYKWIRAVGWAHQHMEGFPGEVLLLADREGDFYENFAAAHESSVDILVRVHHLVRYVMYEQQRVKLQEVVDSLPVVGSMSVNVPRQAGRAARQAILQISYAPILCIPPTGKKGESFPLWLICARETAGQEVKDPIAWYLLCSVAVETLEQACGRVKDYTRRWLIERFHYVLKQGLGAERLQFDTFRRLSHGLEICSIVAWHVLWLSQLAKEHAQVPATDYVSQEDVALVEKISNSSIRTTGEWLIALSKLAGFMPSRKQPFPGEKLLWQSIQLFLAIKKGYLIAQQQNCGTG